MSKASILVVEDESGIAQFVCASLSAAGMLPRAAATAAEADRELAAGPTDLLVVDLGLPDEDGLSFIARLRRTSALPVLVLSARSQEAQKIAALDAGADDYLVKPFGVGELLARVRAMLRRAAGTPRPAPVLQVGALAYDRASRELRLDGEPVHLTPREAARIQGFPDSFVFAPNGGVPSKKSLSKWIGDAVPSWLGYAAVLTALSGY